MNLAANSADVSSDTIQGADLKEVMQNAEGACISTSGIRKACHQF